MRRIFTKMQGCGNDYIYLDCRRSGVPADIKALCEAMCPRHLSVGADGIICICAPETPGAHATMRMFNADGSEGSMCGNGIRCVAQWLHTHEPALAKTSPLEIDTRSGRKSLVHQGDGVWQVEMGRYSLLGADLPAVGLGDGPLVQVPLTVQGKSWTVSCVSTGNPHCVTIVPSVDDLPMQDIGPAFEHHEAFPEGVNTEFVQVMDATHLRMRVWERGSGETWACGTGTCASVVAMVEQGICPVDTPVEVTLLGGKLTVTVGKDQTIRLTGPARTVFEGEWTPNEQCE